MQVLYYISPLKATTCYCRDHVNLCHSVIAKFQWQNDLTELRTQSVRAQITTPEGHGGRFRIVQATLCESLYAETP